MNLSNLKAENTPNICVGLFGTCGGSKWRDSVMAELFIRNIPYFNPQIDGWTPEFAVVEAEHLMTDDIILFPVTGETYGAGSLAEVGFSINSALKSINGDSFRFLIVMIDMKLDDELMGNASEAKNSLRTRALVLAHLNKINHPNVYVAKDLSEMTEMTMQLSIVAERMKNIRAKFKA